MILCIFIKRVVILKKISIVFISIFLMMAASPIIVVMADDGDVTLDYGDVTLTGEYQAGHFPEVWDLTAFDLVISFTYDAFGLIDDFGDEARAWAELGIRVFGEEDFIHTAVPEGLGVCLLAYFPDVVGTLDPDPPVSPNFDPDDILILFRGENRRADGYNLPSPPPEPYRHHRLHFDRDGVSPTEALNPTHVDGGTYNTGGVYEIIITLHAESETSGTAYMTVNGLDQGFETDGDWTTIELTPAGVRFAGDMKNMQVFYGFSSYGAAHSVAFRDIRVTAHYLGTPENLKQQAYQNLGDVFIGEKNIDHQIAKAMYHIERSLDPSLWNDDGISRKHGHKIFNEEKKAVKKAMKLIDKDGSQENGGIYQDTIDLLIEADRKLAYKMFEEAQENAGDSKVDKELDKVEKELDKAEKHLTKNKYDKAIDHYKKAWKHALKAIKHADKKD